MKYTLQNNETYMVERGEVSVDVLELRNKQDALVSGTNIKTINNNSLLGNGNVDTKEVFEAQYDVATYEDVVAAYNANKIVIVKYFYQSTDNIFVLQAFPNGVGTGNAEFIADRGASVFAIFLTPQSTWNVYRVNLEQSDFKVTSLSASSNDNQYPTAKCVYDNLLLKADASSTVTTSYLQQNYIRKPDVIYQYEDGYTQIFGQQSGSITNNWDLTNLDMTPYKYIKAFIKGSSHNDSATYLSSPIIATIPLDEDLISSSTTVYTGTGIASYPNNHNRLILAFCAVDSTKTKFQLIRTVSLYGSAGTDASDNGRYLYRIEGWYD